jgi:hypothetical protein
LNFDDPAVTLALLKANAVVGVTGFFSKDGGLGYRPARIPQPGLVVGNLK